MRTTPLVAENFYHIYNCGVNRGPIFFHPENWLFFLRRLRQYFVPAKVEMLAYTLMPNHYHLLVRIKSGDFGREIMHPFTISYTMAINRQMNRVGPLFQGPYQARCIKEDADLLNLSGYIHLNPVSAGLVASPEQWEYSSYRDYLGRRPATFVSPKYILAQFPSRQAYAAYVCDQANFKVPRKLLFE